MGTMLAILLVTAVYGNTLHLRVCSDCCCEHCPMPLDIGMDFDTCELTTTPTWGWISDVCINGDTVTGNYFETFYSYENTECHGAPNNILKRTGGCYSTAKSMRTELRQYASLYPRYKIQRCVYYDPNIYPAPAYPDDDYPDLRSQSSHAPQEETTRNYVIATVIILLVLAIGVYSGWKIYKRLKRRNLTGDELLMDDHLTACKAICSH